MDQHCVVGFLSAAEHSIVKTYYNVMKTSVSLRQDLRPIWNRFPNPMGALHRDLRHRSPQPLVLCRW